MVVCGLNPLPSLPSSKHSTPFFDHFVRFDQAIFSMLTATNKKSFNHFATRPGASVSYGQTFNIYEIHRSTTTHLNHR